MICYSNRVRGSNQFRFYRIFDHVSFESIYSTLRHSNQFILFYEGVKFEFIGYVFCDSGLFYYTVWLKWIAHFEVGIIFIHQYKSDLAHLSYLHSLVIGLYKYEG